MWVVREGAVFERLAGRVCWAVKVKVGIRSMGDFLRAAKVCKVVAIDLDGVVEMQWGRRSTETGLVRTEGVSSSSHPCLLSRDDYRALTQRSVTHTQFEHGIHCFIFIQQHSIHLSFHLCQCSRQISRCPTSRTSLRHVPISPLLSPQPCYIPYPHHPHCTAIHVLLPASPWLD